MYLTAEVAGSVAGYRVCLACPQLLLSRSSSPFFTSGTATTHGTYSSRYCLHLIFRFCLVLLAATLWIQPRCCLIVNICKIYYVTRQTTVFSLFPEIQDIVYQLLVRSPLCLFTGTRVLGRVLFNMLRKHEFYCVGR